MQTAVGQDTQMELDALCDLQPMKFLGQWHYVVGWLFVTRDFSKSTNLVFMKFVTDVCVCAKF